MESNKILQYVTVQDYIKRTLPKSTEYKIQQFLDALNEEQISYQRIRELSYTGIPDECQGLRSIYWRLLFCLLKNEKQQWEKDLDENNKIYQIFVQEFLSKRDQQQDQELWDEIEKDTTRTRSDMHFFNKEKQNPQNQNENQNQKNENENEKHHEVLLRILFIYCKLNPGIGYCQGMNELLAPIYYCFSNDNNPTLSNYVESDSFFCFMRLMSEVKEQFLRSCDSTENGIKARIQKLNILFRESDTEYWQYFEDIKISPYYYSFRWLLLLLTQEFLMSDILILWDTLLSQENKLDYLNYICLGILFNKKHELMNKDFSNCLQSLQNLESISIYEIISTGQKLLNNQQKNKK